MKDEIERAIKVLLSKIDDDIVSDMALKYTQSALNLAHTLDTMVQSQDYIDEYERELFGNER